VGYGPFRSDVSSVTLAHEGSGSVRGRTESV